MQVHFSYQHGSPHSQLENIIGNHISKLEKLLVHFSPDVVHLHGTIEFGTTNQEPKCSLHLWLPTSQIHAKEHGADLPTIVRVAFEHIESQVKKHKEILRHEGERRKGKIGPVLAEQQTNDAQFQVNTRQQLREYLEQVLPQLKSFVAREIRYQELSGVRIATNSEEEIVNEVVAIALENHATFASSETPFHGLLREAILALNGKENGSTVAKIASDGANVSSTYAKADPVDQCLSRIPAKMRQLYVLHSLEGFSYDEAALAVGEQPGNVEDAIRSVRMQVSEAIVAMRPNGDASV
jgi:DNA-directed RNA polymerase specialized sigma24 family protein/ribosome-associated translation inhibitor RaiA